MRVFHGRFMGLKVVRHRCCIVLSEYCNSVVTVLHEGVARVLLGCREKLLYGFFNSVTRVL